MPRRVSRESVLGCWVLLAVVQCPTEATEQTKRRGLAAFQYKSLQTCRVVADPTQGGWEGQRQQRRSRGLGALGLCLEGVRRC